MKEYCVKVTFKDERISPKYFYYDESYSNYINDMKEKFNNELQTYANPSIFVKFNENTEYIEEGQVKEVTFEEALNTKLGKIVKTKKFYFA